MEYQDDYREQNWETEQPQMPKQSPFADSPYVIQQPQQYAPPQPAPKRKGKAGKRILCALLALLLVVATSFATAALMGGSGLTAARELANARDTIERLEKRLQRLEKEQGAAFIPDSDNQSNGLMTPAGVYAQNVDAVVAISNQGLTTNIFGQMSQTASSGSGFIISSDGYVVSNYHVVAGANTLKVILSDGTEHAAELVGYDASNDISVLKINGEDLPCVKFGSSDALAVGERVAAIGNPLGELTSTLTVGYVSAKDRNVNTDGTAINMIQTDAAINSGNSGGPLFNMHGEVVGITTAKYSGTSGSGATIEGIGFAIPIDDVVGMIDDIRDKGYVSGAYLGVMVQDVSTEAIELYGFPAGALVMEVTPGFCAERAGIQAKDVIVSIDGKAVDSVSGLTRVLRDYEAGDTAEVMLYRTGKDVKVTLTFDERPADLNEQTQQTPQQQLPPQYEEQDPFDWFGGFWPFG